MGTTSDLGFLAEMAAERAGNAQLIRIDYSLEQAQRDQQLVYFEVAGKSISVEIKNTFLEDNDDDVVIAYLVEAINMSR
jgi:hypothetical protein